MQMRTVTLSDGSAVAIEVSEASTATAQFLGRSKRDDVAKKALVSLSELGQIAMTYAEDIYGGADQLLTKIKPSRFALEFSIGVEGEAGIPFVAAGRANAALVVTMEWER